MHDAHVVPDVACRHLNGGQLSNVPSRPALLITDCSRVHIKAMNRATREKALKDAILGVLRRQVRRLAGNISRRGGLQEASASGALPAALYAAAQALCV